MKNLLKVSSLSVLTVLCSANAWALPSEYFLDAGYYHDVEKAEDWEDVLPCVAGYYCPGGDYSCSSGWTPKCQFYGAGDDDMHFGLVPCPAGTTSNAGAKSVDECFAAGPTLYNDTINESCKVDFLGSSSGNALNSFAAEYTPNNYTMAAGQYLAGGEITGTECPANSFCIGGTYTFSDDDDQGIESCPDDFTLSVVGTSNENDCYHTCTAYDIENSSKVASVTSGTVTKGGTNTCTATCTTGYTFKAAKANPLSGKEGTDGTGYAAKGNDGNEDYTYGGKKQSDYNLTQNGSWGTSFSYGDITGISSCNTTPGTSIYNSDAATIKPGNTFNQSSSGQYCWCKITGYKATGGTLQDLSASSSWVFHATIVSSYCASNCAMNCTDSLRWSVAFRAELFGRSVSATIEPAACVANEITVSWNPNNGQSASTNQCTYDGDITLPTAPEKTGYTFSGWKLVTGSSSN